MAKKLSAAWLPGQPRPITKTDVKKWRKRLDLAETRSKQFHEQWKRGLENYAKALEPKQKQDVDALLDFRHVEGKKAALFHQTPEVQLTPIDPKDEAIPIQVYQQRQKVLNHKLGPDAADAQAALHATLIDTIAASGWLILKIGYEDVKLPVPPDPVTLQQPLGLDGKPLEVPVWWRHFMVEVSSKKLLVPHDFHSTRYDAAPWLAVKGVMSVSQALRSKWVLPEDYKGTAAKDEDVYEHGTRGDESSDKMVEYTEVWYRAALFDPAVFNPELYRCLILVKGSDEPAWHVDSPYQSLTPTGQITDDSMIGCPIHVGAIRDLTDSAYVPSDLVVGEQLSTEVNKFRTGLIRGRKGRMPITLVSDAVDTVVAEKIFNDRAAVVPAQHIQQGGVQDLVSVVQAGSEPRDNYAAQDYAERDHEQAFGQSANQSGAVTKQKRTATESRIVQGNASARASVEQARVRKYFVAAVRKFDAVLQRTMTPAELVKILGQQGAALWEQWRLLSGRYTYGILPDAGKYVDAQQARAEAIDFYNMTRKDDRVNPEVPLEHLARVFYQDPAKFIAPPSGKTSEPPKLTLSVKTEDLHDPLGGQTLLAFMKNGGMQVPPEFEALIKAAAIIATVAGNIGGKNPDGTPVNNGTAPHGGSADKTEPVNQHARQRTGGVQGMGVQ